MERTLDVSESDLLAALEEIRLKSAGEGALTTVEVAELLFSDTTWAWRTKVQKARELLKQLQARGMLDEVKKDTDGLGGPRKVPAYQLGNKTEP